MIQKLDINKKRDNETRIAQIIKANLPSAEYISAADMNAVVEKINEMIPEINAGISGFQGVLKINEKREDVGFYFPAESGTYPNAGNITVNTDEGFNFIIYDGNKWEVSLVPVELKQYVTKYDLGISEIIKDNNIIEELALSEKGNNELWEKGNLAANGGITPTETTLYSKKYYPILPGKYSAKIIIGAFGVQRLHVYNKNYEVIQVIQNNSDGTEPYNFNFEVTDKSARFIRITQIEKYSNSTIFIKALENYELISDDVFLTKQGDEVNTLISNSITEKMNDLGYRTIEKGTNVFSEINGKPQEEGDYFGKGYLTSVGEIDPQGRKWHTKKYYEVFEGDYEALLYFVDNDNLVIYDIDYKPIKYIKNPAGNPATFKGTVTIPKGGKYVRTTIIDGQMYVDKMYLKNLNDITITPTSKTTDLREILKLSNSPKETFPIVTFVSDDGMIQNDWFVEILNKHSVKATFAIVTGWWEDIELSKNIFTRDELKALLNDGHDLAGHTHTHPRLADKSTEEVEVELFNNKQYLTCINPDANIFVAPFGSRTVEVDKVIRKYYDCDIKTSFRYNSPTFEGVSNIPPIDTYLLKRFSFDIQERNISVINEAKQAVDQAIKERGWLIFAIHPHYNEYRTDLAGGKMRRKELDDLIIYIKSLNIPILTAKDALKIYRNPISIGNKGVDDSYWEIGINGQEIESK